jgi:hypothetical protein
MIWKSTASPDSEPITENKPKRSLFRWVALGIGTLFGAAHFGVIGHLMNKTQIPIINLPVGEYTAYQVEAYEGGYRIQYRANSPQVMSKNKIVAKKNGFFGIGGNAQIVQQEEYTMNGAAHLQGGAEGKLTAQKIECIKAEGGGENAGRMVGASVGTAIAPWFTSIPYIGWLAAGWAVMLGQDKGAEIGGDIAKMVKDCE